MHFEHFFACPALTPCGNPPQLTPLHQFHRGDPCPHTQPFGRKSIHKKAQPQAAQSKMHHTHGLVLFRRFVQNSHRATHTMPFIHTPAAHKKMLLPQHKLRTRARHRRSPRTSTRRTRSERWRWCPRTGIVLPHPRSGERYHSGDCGLVQSI